MLGWGGNNYTTYSHQTVRYGRPSIRAWCWQLLFQLPVFELVTRDTKADFKGSSLFLQWCTWGIREAAERAADDESYSFLRVIPFLRQQYCLPDINLGGTKKKEMQRRCKNFKEAVNELKVLVESALESAAMEISALQQLSSDNNNVSFESQSLKMAREWLKSVVRFSPTIDILKEVLDDPVFKPQVQYLMYDVGDW